MNGDGRFQWQKSFHDHIIRGEGDLTRVREYIRNNPLKWEEDVENIEQGAGLPAGRLKDAKAAGGRAGNLILQ